MYDICARRGRDCRGMVVQVAGLNQRFRHGHAALLVRGYGFVRNSSFCIRPLSADELN